MVSNTVVSSGVIDEEHPLVGDNQQTCPVERISTMRLRFDGRLCVAIGRDSPQHIVASHARHDDVALAHAWSTNGRFTVTLRHFRSLAGPAKTGLCSPAHLRRHWYGYVQPPVDEALRQGEALTDSGTGPGEQDLVVV